MSVTSARLPPTFSYLSPLSNVLSQTSLFEARCWKLPGIAGRGEGGGMEEGGGGEDTERKRERDLGLDGWGPCQQSLLPPWPPATVGGALARGVGEQSSTPLPWRKKERERAGPLYPKQAGKRDRERGRAAPLLEGLCRRLASGGRREVDLELFTPGKPSRLPQRCLSFTPAATLLKRPARARKFLRNLTAAPPLEGGPPVGARNILSACGPGGELEGLPVPRVLQWQAAKMNTTWEEQCKAKKKQQKDKKARSTRTGGTPQARQSNRGASEPH